MLNTALPIFTLIDGKYVPLAGFISGGSFKEIIKTTYQDAFDKYIEMCTSNKCTKNQASEALYFRKMAEFFNEKNIHFISEVTREHIDQLEILFSKSMKPSSVNRRFKTIKHFFNKCDDWKIILENPCKKRSRLKEEDNPRIAWNKEIFNKFINECDGIYKNIFTFMWITGCRQSELLNLKWTDINYDDQTIKLKCGKNSNVARNFPMTPELDVFLHNLKIDSIYVFSENKAQPNTNNLYQYAKHRLNKLGLNNYTPYGLRHGFGTRLANAGVSAFYIAELMGHSKLDTTQKYVHSEKKLLIDIVSKAI